MTFDGQSDYPARYVSWTIPGSIVQSWINYPAGNNGLVLVSQTTDYFEDLYFSSREGGFAAPRFSTSPPLTWTGSANGSWSLARSDANWSGPATAYSDGTPVTFSYSGASHNVTIVAGGVQPAGVTFTNTATRFCFSGGAISGRATVTLNGSGNVTFINANTYTGGTTISRHAAIGRRDRGP